MSAKPNHFKLGLFIILGTVLSIMLTLVLGGGALFKKRLILETYLNESVQGLDVGSKVKFRGVLVGRVERIGFTHAHYQLDKPPESRRRYVLVEMAVDPAAVEEIHSGTTLRILQEEVKKGLRVKLAYVGLTGTAYLELDYENPKDNPPLAVEWEPAHPYVPSASSFITRIFSTTEEFFSRLKKLDIESLLTNLDKLAIEVNRKLEQVPVERLSGHAIELLGELRETNRRLQEVAASPAWDQIPKEAAASLSRVRELLENPAWTNSLASLERSLRSADSLLAGREGDVAATLDNLRVATEQLRVITENAKRYPAQVLFGDPPKPTNPMEERR